MPSRSCHSRGLKPTTCIYIPPHPSPLPSNLNISPLPPFSPPTIPNDYHLPPLHLHNIPVSPPPHSQPPPPTNSPTEPSTPSSPSQSASPPPASVSAAKNPKSEPAYRLHPLYHRRKQLVAGNGGRRRGVMRWGLGRLGRLGGGGCGRR